MVADVNAGELLLKEVVSQVRAYDTYGTWDKKSDEDILQDFLKRETKKSLSFMGHCEVDPKTTLKIYAYFKAIGAVVEKLSGYITSVVINLDHEGNGSVLIYTGRLILVNKTIRDASKFGFKSFEDMKSQGEKLVEKSIKLLEEHPEVARL
ncbi:MAG: NifX-associated nitrogen fixation protein [Aquificaceae bacterium]|nr:NifX-associated nitrogen fixation protein [Aquificaceae bacterium]